MVSSKGDCPIHKKPIIYTYNNKNYCKDCLDGKFEVIEKIRDYHSNT
ncbi:hypothetical protein LCGC14_1594850 [marine sediment metagenome]|uniref:Uncharacterized protein n=1 Tax=marine sediment metagenome TaxID=412755 RepID=A0A0F9ICY7_9ZZZZ